MRPLIEIHRRDLIQCDNPKCDFVIPNETGDPYVDVIEYLNVPCPECGWNLLTEEDYKTDRIFVAIVKWLNKWFSWLTIFRLKSTPMKDYTVRFHEGISINEKKN